MFSPYLPIENRERGKIGGKIKEENREKEIGRFV